MAGKYSESEHPARERNYKLTTFGLETYLKFQKVDFQCTPSSNHASPTGSLPFILPAASTSDLPLPIPSSRIQRWVRDGKSAKKTKSNKSTSSSTAKDFQKEGGREEARENRAGGNSSDMRYDAYMSLLDHRIRNAYVRPLSLEGTPTC